MSTWGRESQGSWDPFESKGSTGTVPSKAFYLPGTVELAGFLKFETTGLNQISAHSARCPVWSGKEKGKLGVLAGPAAR